MPFYCQPTINSYITTCHSIVFLIKLCQRIGSQSACGHNLISEAGLAAGIGIKAAIESCPDNLSGNVVLLGTPAEEGGGGKIELAERGAFNGVDLAMMVHGAPMTVAYCNALAIESVRVRYYGKWVCKV